MRKSKIINIGDPDLSNLNDLLSNLIDQNRQPADSSSKKDDNQFKWADIIEFCESPYFLGIKPYPWQKMILKLFYMGSPGNRHLEINKEESGCKNCIWYKNALRAKSPCLKCSIIEMDYYMDILEAMRKEMWVSYEDIKEVLNCEKENNFMNEMMLIEKDLINDSDSINGGSVKKQVLDKIKKEFRELLLVLGRRAGKALHIDTPIPTPDGWKTMKDIKPGDYVFGMDGQPTLVIGETEIMYDRPCYEIEFDNEEIVICDEEHTWLTLTFDERKHNFKSPNLKQFSTKELSDSIYFKDTNYSNHAIPSNCFLRYEEKKLPIDPYILGLLIGNTSRNSFFLNNLDKELLEEFEKFGFFMTKMLSMENRWLINDDLIEILKENNLFKNKHIPEIYLQSSFEQRLELLKGILDARAEVPSTGTIEIKNLSEKLKDQISELIQSLGMVPKISIGDLSEELIFLIQEYNISFNENNFSVFKYKNYDVKQTIPRFFIRNIRKLDKSYPVKCIEVHNENNTYLCTKSMIPTHNSMLVSIIALYETYKTIEMKNPQAYFGNLNDGDTICILNVAVSERQATEAVFDKIRSMVLSSAYFKTKMSPGSMTNQSVRFCTERDNEINKRLAEESLPQRDGSIYLLSGHSNSDSLVGKNILVVIIDEMASMVGKDGSKMSDEELYTKLKHSGWTFGQMAKIICISNPLTKDGKFFELYEQSFSDDRILMIQLPSYAVNPSLDRQELDAEKEAAQKAGEYEAYKMQIEARFSGGAADPFIPSEFIDAAFQKGSSRRKSEVGNPNVLYYMHLDPANNSDNYALAMVHVEKDMYNLGPDNKPKEVVVVDHIHMWMPSVTGEPVNITDVDQYVIKLFRRFKIVSVTYDMWESASSTQLLQRMGLPARITPFNSSYKQTIYSTLRNLFFEQRIEFYQHDGFNPELKQDTYSFSMEAMDQFKFLEKRFNAHSFSVSAAAGHYDDIPDCIAGASYIALTGQHGYVTLPRIKSLKMKI